MNGKCALRVGIVLLASSAFGETRGDPTPERIERGRYLATVVMTCIGCHFGHGQSSAEGKPFAGGFEFQLPSGISRAANLTPSTTGISEWTKNGFIQRFRVMKDSAEIRIGSNQVNTVMHWWGYALMGERDLGHLFEYLNTLPPVDNEVVTFDEQSTAFEESKWNWSERLATGTANGSPET
jgi:hypothetical protein